MDFNYDEQWKIGLSKCVLKKVRELEENVTKLEKEAKTKQYKCELSEQQVGRLKKEMDEWKERCRELESENKRFMNEIELLERQNNKYVAEIDVKSNRITYLESQVQSCLKKNDELSQQIIDWQSKYQSQHSDRVDGEKDLMQKRINKLNGDLAFQKDLNEKLNKELNELYSEIKWVEDRSVRIGSPMASGDSTDNASTPIKSHLSRAMDSFNSPIRSSPKKTPLSKIEREVDRLKYQIDIQEEENARLKAEMKNMKSSIECERHNESMAKNLMERRFREKEELMKNQIRELSRIISEIEADKENRSQLTSVEKKKTSERKMFEIENIDEDDYCGASSAQQERERERCHLHDHIWNHNGEYNANKNDEKEDEMQHIEVNVETMITLSSSLQDLLRFNK